MKVVLNTYPILNSHRLLKKMLLFKLIVILFVSISQNAWAKNIQQVNLDETNSPFDAVLQKIARQTDYNFVFTQKLIKKAKPVTIQLTDVPLDEALKKLFSSQPLDYTVYNKIVSIKDKEPVKVAAEIQESYDISGTVTDEKGGPMPGATVFLSNTQYATATDDAGKFVVHRLPAGSYEVVVKMMSYEPYVQIVKIVDKPVTLNIKLKETSIELKTVTINAKPDKKRPEYLETFIKSFIGRSANAAQCKILNPGVLRFHYDNKKDILHASAEELLIIENEALGYQIKYLLKDFKFYVDYNISFYSGYPYFEELKGTELQKAQWEYNRKMAYLGSDRHFFRSVMSNTAIAEGFSVTRLNQKANKFIYVPYDELFVNGKDSEKQLITKPKKLTKRDTTREELFVYYTGADKQATSKIVVFADTIAIDKELLLNPTKELNFSGYWARARVAELLPLDFSYTAPATTEENNARPVEQKNTKPVEDEKAKATF